MPLQQPLGLGKVLCGHRALLGCDGNRQPLPSLGAPSLYDQPAVLGGHSDEKTMGSFA